MKIKTLALIHTVNWYDKSVNAPFVNPWLKRNTDVRVFNIMDDSLLAESLAHHGATPLLQDLRALRPENVCEALHRNQRKRS